MMSELEVLKPDNGNLPARMRLARIAREEALRNSPKFSSALHARIMQAIEAVSAPSRGSNDRQFNGHSIAQPSGSRSRILWRRAFVPAVLAAGIALAAAPMAWRLIRSGGVSPVAVSQPSAPRLHARLASTESPVLAIDQTATRMNARMTDAVRTAMGEQQWAGLDHDVRLATRYLVNQVPLRDAWDVP